MSSSELSQKNLRGIGKKSGYFTVRPTLHPLKRAYNSVFRPKNTVSGFWLTPLMKNILYPCSMEQFQIIMAAPRNGTSSNKIFLGIRDFFKNASDQDVIIGMDMSETVGFRPLTRKKFKGKTFTSTTHRYSCRRDCSSPGPIGNCWTRLRRVRWDQVYHN